jgi:hypothetical protein
MPDHFFLYAATVCMQLMERAKISGNLELPPEMMEIMQQLPGAGSQSTAGFRRSSSSNNLRKSTAGPFANGSRVSTWDYFDCGLCVHSCMCGWAAQQRTSRHHHRAIRQHKRARATPRHKSVVFCCLLLLQMTCSMTNTPRRASQQAGGSLTARGSSPAQVQRQQEAALQRILEEEILKEMDREAALREVRVAFYICWSLFNEQGLEHLCVSADRTFCLLIFMATSMSSVVVVCWADRSTSCM